MRNVLRNTDEVAHFWANAVQARGQAGNVSFRSGDRDNTPEQARAVLDYVSYATIVARRVTMNHTGNIVFLFTSQSYSVSTSRHVSKARSAAWTLGRRFKVREVEAHTREQHVQNVEDLLERSAKATLSAKRARSEYRRDMWSDDALNLLADARAYAALFGVLGAVPDDIDMDALAAHVDARRKEIDAERTRRDAEDRARREAQAAEDIAAWRTGGAGYGLHALPPMLRVSMDRREIETSYGARVPYDVARALYLRWTAGEHIAAGEAVGVYATHNATATEMVIGCHTIARAECDALARQEGWTANRAERVA